MKTYDAIPARRAAFLGLGVMGHPMAGHLARAGHAVTVYNRSGAKAQAWKQEFKGAAAATPALVDQFYADVQAGGGKRWDTSSLITRLK